MKKTGLIKRMGAILTAVCLLLAAASCKPNIPTETEGPYPVIIIPGVMGTELQHEGEFVWPPDIDTDSPNGMLQAVAKFMALGLDENAQSQSEITPVRFSPMTEYESGNVGLYGAYTELAVSLSEELGYENVWFFGYDWRLDNRTTAKELSDYIKTVLSETGASKVNIVAHSMGGLVTSAYLAEHKSEGLIDRVITCGTPFLGAQDAYLTLTDGAGFFDISAEFAQFAPAIMSIFATVPTIYQLLPASSWEALELLDENGKLISDATAAEKQGYEFYTDITCNMEEIWKDVEHYNYVGIKQNTHGEAGDEDGDGTVTRYSATLDGKFTAGSHTLYEIELSHVDLVTNIDAILSVIDNVGYTAYGQE